MDLPPPPTALLLTRRPPTPHITVLSQREFNAASILVSVEGMTVLLRALDETPLSTESFEKVKQLIEERHSDPNVCDKQGRNAVGWDRSAKVALSVRTSGNSAFGN